MQEKKKKHTTQKTRLHPRNKHRERYDFNLLIETFPQLKQYVKPNKFGDESVDFFDANAVKALNTALLMHYYDIKKWDIPENYLCPPIPGRADYIHHIADVLSSKNYGKIPIGEKIKCLDVGVGANCVYPIIGRKEYDWSFVGSEIDPVSIESANSIIEHNSTLKGKVELRLQSNNKDVFFGIIQENERFDLTICNPPFHSSLQEMQSANTRKLSNLTHKTVTEKNLNFAGQNNELWCEGGEEKFVKNMIRESKFFHDSCFWFSTLVSKNSSLKNAYKSLKKAEALEIKTIPMGQGNKSSRILAWTFLSPEHQKEWIDAKWNK